MSVHWFGSFGNFTSRPSASDYEPTRRGSRFFANFSTNLWKKVHVPKPTRAYFLFSLFFAFSRLTYRTNVVFCKFKDARNCDIRFYKSATTAATHVRRFDAYSLYLQISTKTESEESKLSENSCCKSVFRVTKRRSDVTKHQSTYRDTRGSVFSPKRHFLRQWRDQRVTSAVTKNLQKNRIFANFAKYRNTDKVFWKASVLCTPDKKGKVFQQMKNLYTSTHSTPIKKNSVYSHTS